MKGDVALVNALAETSELLGRDKRQFAQRYLVSVPEGECGDWRVERQVITQQGENIQKMRVLLNPQRAVRWAPRGTYTYLFRGQTVVMTDTPDEIRDHLEPIRRATGECLVNGLGLGVVVQAMLLKECVEHVTVIERAPEVIQLVGPHYEERFGDRLSIIQADALKWRAPKGAWYDVVWHDIWSNICVDNLETMGTLHRKYGRRCGWQGSWVRDYLKALQREERW